MRPIAEDRVLRQLVPAIRWLTTVAHEADALRDQTAAEIIWSSVIALQILVDTELSPRKLRDLASTTVRI